MMIRLCRHRQFLSESHQICICQVSYSPRRGKFGMPKFWNTHKYISSTCSFRRFSYKTKSNCSLSCNCKQLSMAQTGCWLPQATFHLSPDLCLLTDWITSSFTWSSGIVLWNSPNFLCYVWLSAIWPMPFPILQIILFVPCQGDIPKGSMGECVGTFILHTTWEACPLLGMYKEAKGSTVQSRGAGPSWTYIKWQMIPQE